MTIVMDAPGAVSQRLESFFTERRAEALLIGPHAHDLVDAAAAASRGGKRLRASFLVLGRESIVVAPASSDATDTAADTDATIAAAAALELFQAAALVHDDLIDNSDTRRGLPAAHRALEMRHRERTWAGDPAAHGRSGAILLGDLLVAYSDDLFEQAIAGIPPHRAAAAREAYAGMRRDVTIGQYLDIAEESAYDDPSAAGGASPLDRALTVASYKSARYSVQQPLLIGAALAGADEHATGALARFGLAIGMAFQLRDDLLGVFGDEETTGKPAGDDLREGKRTALIALARASMSDDERGALDIGLGNAHLDDAEVDRLRAMIAASGAVAGIEGLIDRYTADADDALRDAPLAASAVTRLRELAERAVRRSF